MARAKIRPPKKPPLRVHSLTLTPAEEDILARLAQDATDYIGRKVSGSAVLRTLLRQADQHGAAWVRAQLCPFIEREVTSGLRWGRKTC